MVRVIRFFGHLPIWILPLLLSLSLSSCVPAPVTPSATEPALTESSPAPANTAAPATPIPTAPCLSETASKTLPSVFESLRPWQDPVVISDPPGDFLLDQPLYEENFGVPGIFEHVQIPDALDIVSVKMMPEGQFYLFEFRMQNAETRVGESLVDLLKPGRRVATMGIYFDTDQNGASEYLATTTDESLELGVLLPPALDERIASVNLRVSDSSMMMFVPKEVVGDRFSWLAFTGYSPIEGFAFQTPLSPVFFEPVIDVIYPQDLPINIGYSTAYTGHGVTCQVTDSGLHTCPAQGGNSVPVPGTSYSGVLIYRASCGNRGYAFWCLSGSFFGKEVFDQNSQLGWIAKCPYHCGLNSEDRWDQTGDGLVDKIFHSTRDVDCADGYHDGDNDGYLDVMTRTYFYPPSNQLTDCNEERKYTSGQALVNKRCNNPQAPWSDPSQCPSYIP
jgi:hypothetical protein